MSTPGRIIAISLPLAVGGACGYFLDRHLIAGDNGKILAFSSFFSGLFHALTVQSLRRLDDPIWKGASPQFADTTERKLKRLKEDVWSLWAVGVGSAVIALVFGIVLQTRLGETFLKFYLCVGGYAALAVLLFGTATSIIVFRRVSHFCREYPIELDRLKRKNESLTRLERSKDHCCS